MAYFLLFTAKMAVAAIWNVIKEINISNWRLKIGWLALMDKLIKEGSHVRQPEGSSSFSQNVVKTNSPEIDYISACQVYLLKNIWCWSLRPRAVIFHLFCVEHIQSVVIVCFM